MRLELHYRSDVDLSQPAIQVEIRSHILRCLRDFPQSGVGGDHSWRGRALFATGARRSRRDGGRSSIFRVLRTRRP
jgi:hypothetical protein